MRFLLFLIIIALTACSGQTDQNKPLPHDKLAPGPWRFTLDLNGTELPFQTMLNLTGSGRFSLEIENAGERILAKDGRVVGDSIYIYMPTFNSEFRGRVESPFLLAGYWYNHNKGAYRIPFVADQGKTFRFSPTRDTTNIPRRYKVVFSPKKDNSFDAILELYRDSTDKLTGTFLTETGDYRFLEGNIIQNRLYLSTFDGSHAYYFSAVIGDNKLTQGIFKSGIHYETSWQGVADTVFTLTDPTALTSLKYGMDTIDFRLPNQSGDTVSWSDLNLKDKVVIVEITGSWCPNCMDANRALSDLLKGYDKNVVTVLPITFEITDDLERALPSINRMQAATGMGNSFLFGGKANRENVERALPMLDQFMSYPTLIFVGKDRRVARIFTGFYGPGTGSHYDEFMTDSKSLLDSLVAAKPAIP